MPLTKSYSIDDNNNIVKSNYPTVAKFTSHEEQCANLPDMYKQIVAHAKLGHCLLKGELRAPLSNESRAGSTDGDAKTWFMDLDLDKAPFPDVETALATICEANKASPFENVSYIVQYSASHGLPGTVGLNCHVFFILDQDIPAPILKAWLMQLNLKCKTLSDSVSLSSTNATLSWPLDITTCQNDKLLYITPPQLSAPLIKLIGKNKFDESLRYQLIKKDLDTLPIARIGHPDLNTMKQAAHKRKNEMRKAKGMDVMRLQPKLEGDHYVITSPGEAVITSELRVANGFVTFNINGGDSWSYYHPVDKYDYIRCFKHPDEWFRTSELLPNYYRKLEAERIAQNAAPTDEGDVILTFSDFKSSSYWRGLWNPRQYKLDLSQVSGVAMLNDWRKSFGRDELEFTPIWDIRFDPTSNVVVDEANKTVNTYVATKLMRNVYTYNEKANYKRCPMIINTLMHVLNCTEADPELEHMLNWLAVLYQTRNKTMTAWVLSGIEGTGKGVLGKHILAATLGTEYVAMRMGNALEEIYNGWMENSIVCILDEVDLAISTKKNLIHQNMKKFITDSPVPYRHMHRMGYQANSYSNFILCTNSKEPIHITEDNRRYNIGTYQPEKLNYTQKDLDAIARELPAWVEYIMTRKADVILAATVLKNAAHSKLVDVSRTSSEDITDKLKQGDLSYFLHMMPDMELQTELHGLNTQYAEQYSTLVKREITALVNSATPVNLCSMPDQLVMRRNGARIDKTSVYVSSKLSREELQCTFEYAVGNIPATPAKFTQFLRHKGINIEAIWNGGKTQRGVVVQWVATAAQLQEMQDWLAASAAPRTSTVVSINKARIA